MITCQTKRTGAHTDYGMFAACGQGIQQVTGTPHPAKNWDVAPTVLAMFGIDQPDDYDGQQLPDVHSFTGKLVMPKPNEIRAGERQLESLAS